MTRTVSPMEEEAIKALRECGADEALADQVMTIVNRTVDNCLELSRREIKRQTGENLRAMWLLGFTSGVTVALSVAMLSKALQ
ncbi:MAG TPA: hypothetical protein VK602_15055 [Phyllobacterium sp.]|nr:hypothetical protein [Phyllobacterium sp.]